MVPPGSKLGLRQELNSVICFDPGQLVLGYLLHGPGVRNSLPLDSRVEVVAGLPTHSSMPIWRDYSDVEPSERMLVCAAPSLFDIAETYHILLAPRQHEPHGIARAP